MEEIKEFIFEDVIFQLKTFHNVNTDNDDVIELVNKVIDEEYDNFIASTESWEPDPYIEKVIKRMIEITG